MAGIGDIRPLTFGDLLHAAQARVDYDLTKQSSLMALIANTRLDSRKQRPFRPEDFYRPRLHRRERKVMGIERLHALRGAFTKRKG